MLALLANIGEHDLIIALIVLALIALLVFIIKH